MVEVRVGLRLLETLTSALYEDPIILFREYVQNSADAYNMAIDEDSTLAFNEFKIDIDIDADNFNILIKDNGYGIPESEFIDKMTTIGASNKSNFTDQIGFRGIGRLSGMPFCKELVFINKPVGLNKCLIYTWEGEKFHKFLNQEIDLELNAAVEKISSSREEYYEGNINEHFFKVELHGYQEEIKELVDSDFKQRLSKMLPLNYSPDFSQMDVIKNKYKQYMGESLDKYSFKIFLNGEFLYKPYSNKHILESDIVFWELKFKSNKSTMPGDKFGILWFTFNRKLSGNPITEPYGILVRSKNMLMGGSDSLADAIIRSRVDYVATYRELVQTLTGVYGEMLINTPRLNDNARRDWFKIDSLSIELRNIIVEFMKHLLAYRNCASKAFNNPGNEKIREKLIKAYSDLTDGYKPEKFINDFYQHRDSVKSNDDKVFEFADDDIPHFSITIRRFYDRLAKCLRIYYLEKKELEEFLKIRAYIKKHFNEEQEG